MRCGKGFIQLNYLPQGNEGIHMITRLKLNTHLRPTVADGWRSPSSCIQIQPVLQVLFCRLQSTFSYVSNLQIKSPWYLKAVIIHLAVMNQYSAVSQSTESSYQLLIDL